MISLYYTSHTKAYNTIYTACNIVEAIYSFTISTFQKLESLAYIFVAACMGLSSFKFVQWTPKDASFLHQTAFWPFKVVQGHPSRWFWYQSKAHIDVYDFLLVGHCEYGPILHCFWGTVTNWLKIANFCYPSLIRRPRSLCSPLEFLGKVNREETRVMGLSSSEDRMIVAVVVLAWYQRVTDRWLDGGRTVRQNPSWLIHSKLCWRAVKMHKMHKLKIMLLK